MRCLSCGLILSVLFAASGCGPSDAEVAKHEPLAKEMIQLMTELTNTVESVGKERPKSPAAAKETADKIQSASNQLMAKAQEYQKLPKNVQHALDVKYKAQIDRAESRMKEVQRKYKL